MSRDASLRTRGNRRYSFADHGNSTVGARQGMYVIKNNLATYWNPCYGDGVTVMRPYPQPDWEHPENGWQPFRTSSERGHFSDWIRRYDAVRSFGDPGVTFIVSDPTDELAEPQHALPAHVLYNAINNAVSRGQDQPGWAALLKGGRGRSAQLSRPSEIYLIQGAVLQHKQEVYNQIRGFHDDKPLVMGLSSQAGRALLEQLEILREGHQAQEGDWENMYANGDPISLDYGRYVTFYKTADGDPRERAQQATTGWQAAPQGNTGARQGEQIGFSCFMEPTFRGMPANLRSAEQIVRSHVAPWDDVLWFPSVEEQANLIADGFPASVITYAWQEHPDWIPERVRHAAVAQSVVGAPPGGWHQGWNQQQYGFGPTPGNAMMPPAAPVPGLPQAPPPPQPQQFAPPPPQPQLPVQPQQFAPPPQPPAATAMTPAASTFAFGGPPQQSYVPPGGAETPAAAPVPPPQPPAAFPPGFGAAPTPSGPGFAQPPATQQFAPPPQPPIPQGALGTPPMAPPMQPSPPPAQAMAWGAQGNAVAPLGTPPTQMPPTQLQPPVSPMGQMPGGFAPQPPAAPVPGLPQAPPPPQPQLPVQPQQFAPPPQPDVPPTAGRAAAALAAAQQAAAVGVPPG